MPPSPSTAQNDLARELKALHIPGQPLLLANVWDGASAATIASHPSTKAIATASYAVAATQGLEDAELTLEGNLTGIRNVVAGMKKAGKMGVIPLTADLQEGYDDPAATIRRAVELGVVGCNIEDVDDEKGELRSGDEACERIRMVLRGAAESGVPDFVVNARTDVLGYGGGIGDVIERGRRYLEAGATSVFVWGVGKWEVKAEEVERMVEAFGGMLAVQPGVLGVQRLAELGVCRVSVGPGLWRGSMGVLEGEGVRLGVL